MEQKKYYKINIIFKFLVFPGVSIKFILYKVKRHNLLFQVIWSVKNCRSMMINNLLVIINIIIIIINNYQ